MINPAKPLVLLAAILAAFASGTRAQASLITGLGDPASAIPGGTQITFGSMNVGPTTAPTTIGGVTFAQGDGLTYVINNAYDGIYNNTGSSLQNTYGGTQQFIITFSSPVSAFAFNFGASDDVWTLNAYDSSHNLIESDLLTPPTGASNAGEYFGIRAPGIASATLTDMPGISDDYVFIDNFTYGAAAVPEPSSLVSGALATLAGMGYSWRRRRREARHPIS